MNGVIDACSLSCPGNHQAGSRHIICWIAHFHLPPVSTLYMSSFMVQFYNQLPAPVINEDFLWQRLEPLLHYLPAQQRVQVSQSLGSS